MAARNSRDIYNQLSDEDRRKADKAMRREAPTRSDKGTSWNAQKKYAEYFVKQYNSMKPQDQKALQRYAYDSLTVDALKWNPDDFGLGYDETKMEDIERRQRGLIPLAAAGVYNKGKKNTDGLMAALNGDIPTEYLTKTQISDYAKKRKASDFGDIDLSDYYADDDEKATGFLPKKFISTYNYDNPEDVQRLLQGLPSVSYEAEYNKKIGETNARNSAFVNEFNTAYKDIARRLDEGKTVDDLLADYTVGDYLNAWFEDNRAQEEYRKKVDPQTPEEVQYASQFAKDKLEGTLKQPKRLFEGLETPFAATDIQQFIEGVAANHSQRKQEAQAEAERAAQELRTQSLSEAAAQKAEIVKNARKLDREEAVKTIQKVNPVALLSLSGAMPDDIKDRQMEVYEGADGWFAVATENGGIIDVFKPGVTDPNVGGITEEKLANFYGSKTAIETGRVFTPSEVMGSSNLRRKEREFLQNLDKAGLKLTKTDTGVEVTNESGAALDNAALGQILPRPLPSGFTRTSGAFSSASSVDYTEILDNIGAKLPEYEESIQTVEQRGQQDKKTEEQRNIAKAALSENPIRSDFIRTLDSITDWASTGNEFASALGLDKGADVNEYNAGQLYENATSKGYQRDYSSFLSDAVALGYSVQSSVRDEAYYNDRISTGLAYSLNTGAVGIDDAVIASTVGKEYESLNFIEKTAVTIARIKDPGLTETTPTEIGQKIAVILERLIAGAGQTAAGLYDVFANIGNDGQVNRSAFSQRMDVIQEDITQSAYSERKGVEMFGELAYEGVRMYATALLGGAAGSLVTGTSKAARIGAEVLKSAPYLSQSVASAYHEAARDGATADQAFGYALAAGTFEGLTERFMGDVLFENKIIKSISNSMWGKALAKGAVRIGAQGIAKYATPKVISFILKAVGEGLQESSSGIGQGLAKKLIYSHDMPWTGPGGVFDMGARIQEFTMGALLGGILGGLGMGSESRSQKLAATIVETGVESGTVNRADANQLFKYLAVESEIGIEGLSPQNIENTLFNFPDTPVSNEKVQAAFNTIKEVAGVDYVPLETLQQEQDVLRDMIAARANGDVSTDQYTAQLAKVLNMRRQVTESTKANQAAQDAVRTIFTQYAYEYKQEYIADKQAAQEDAQALVEMSGVDSAAIKEYNTLKEEGDIDDNRRVEGEAYPRGNAGAGVEQGESRGVGRRILLSLPDKQINIEDARPAYQNERGTFYDVSGSGKAFYDLIGEAKKTNPHGAYVTQYTQEEYADKRLFISDDGTSGVAVTSAGDIVSVFKSAASTKKGVAGDLLITALQNGGIKLDAFDGFLPKLYQSYGFEPAATVSFNREYAPDGWDYERDGEPKVVFFIHNGDSPEQVLEKRGTYEYKDIDALPVFPDYDSAAQYRDSLIRQNATKAPQGAFSMPTDVQAMAAGATATQTDSAYAGRNFRIAPQSAEADAKALKPVSDTLKTLSKELGVPIADTRFKRSLKKKAQGYYDLHSETIVSRLSNDIQTDMHEVGHHLNKRYGLTSKPGVEAMINKLPAEFQAAYKPEELMGEAVAEFTKHYMINPEAARVFGGEFYDAFENALSKKDLPALQKARTDILNWYGGDVWARTGSTMRGLAKPTKDSKQHAEWAITTMVDRHRPFKVFDDAVKANKGEPLSADKSVEILARNANYAINTATTILKDNLVTPGGEVLETGGFVQIFSDMTNEERQNWGIYLKNKHAIDWAAQGKRVYTDDISMADVQAAVEQYEAVNPDKVRKAQELYDWWGEFINEWYVKTGLLDAGTFQKWRAIYPHYVPNYRASETPGGVEKGFGNQDSHIKRAYGSSRDTYNPIESMMRDVSRVVNIVKRRQVGLAVHEAYQTTEGLGDFIRKVDKDLVVQKVGTADVKAKIAEAFKEQLNPMASKAAADIMDEVMGDMLMQFLPQKFTNDTSVFAVVDKSGKTVWYEAVDPLFVEALNGLNDQKVPDFLKGVAKVTRGVKRAITGSNPLFAIASNIWRDLGEAYIYGSEGNLFKYLAQNVAAYKDIISQSDAYKSFKAMGGTGDYVGTVFRPNQVEQMIKDINSKNWAKKAFNAMESFNNAIEMSTRLAEYKRGDLSTEAGRQASFRKAMEVTVDFRTSGTWAPGLDAAFMFYNASVQGVYKAARAASDKKKLISVLARTLVSSVLAQLGLDLYNYAVAPDRRALLPKRITDNYYVAWVGGEAEFIRIPKPQTLFVSVLGAGGERLFDAIVNGNEDAFKGFLGSIAEDLTPFSSPVWSPITDIGRNETWYGTPIVSRELEKLPDELQYDDTTSAIGKIIGKTFNLSPKKVDYFIKQYSGVIGQILLPATTGDGGPANVLESFTRRMTVSPAFTNDVVDGYYDNKEWLEGVVDSYKLKSETPQVKGDAKKAATAADILLNGPVLKVDKNGDPAQRGESVLKTGAEKLKDLQRKRDGAKTDEEAREYRYQIINLCGKMNAAIEEFKEQYK